MKQTLISLMALVVLSANAGNIGSMHIQSLEDDKVESTSSDRKQLKEIGLYEFEFSFLPVVAKNVSPDEQGAELLSDVEYLMREILPRFGGFVDMSPSEIKVETVGEGVDAVVVWQMPAPYEMPMASFIAFIPEKEAERYRTFYLESSINFDGDGPAWVLGVMNDEGHANYGSVKDPKSSEKFVKLIRKLAYQSK